MMDAAATAARERTTAITLRLSVSEKGIAQAARNHMNATDAAIVGRLRRSRLAYRSCFVLSLSRKRRPPSSLPRLLLKHISVPDIFAMNLFVDISQMFVMTNAVNHTLSFTPLERGLNPAQTSTLRQDF